MPDECVPSLHGRLRQIRANCEHVAWSRGKSKPSYIGNSNFNNETTADHNYEFRMASHRCLQRVIEAKPWWWSFFSDEEQIQICNNGCVSEQRKYLLNCLCCLQSNGNTPLMRVCCRGNRAILELLLRYGADLNIKDHVSGSVPGNSKGSFSLNHLLNFIQSNWTALHHAAHAGSMTTARVLLENNAVVNQVRSRAAALFSTFVFECPSCDFIFSDWVLFSIARCRVSWNRAASDGIWSRHELTQSGLSLVGSLWMKPVLFRTGATPCTRPFPIVDLQLWSSWVTVAQTWICKIRWAMQLWWAWWVVVLTFAAERLHSSSPCLQCVEHFNCKISRAGGCWHRAERFGWYLCSVCLLLIYNILSFIQQGKSALDFCSPQMKASLLVSRAFQQNKHCIFLWGVNRRYCRNWTVDWNNWQCCNCACHRVVSLLLIFLIMITAFTAHKLMQHYCIQSTI